MHFKTITLICIAILMLFTSVVLAAYQKVADNTVSAYHNPELTQRTGNERVDKGDLVTVLEERSNAYYVRYPVKNGTKDRWVPKNIFNSSTQTSNSLKGDVNGDGRINQEDANLALDYVKGKRTSLPVMANADMNGDGKVTLADVQKILNIAKSDPNVRLSPSGYAYPLGEPTNFSNGHDCAKPEGTPIYAVESGTATFSQIMGTYGNKGYATVSYGNYIELKCDNGAEARYGHLSRFEGVNLKYTSIQNKGSTYKLCKNYGKQVLASRRVNKGDIIGYVGTTGNSTGNHLHFEFYIGGAKQNINDYFNK